MRSSTFAALLAALALTGCMSVGVDLAPSTTPLEDGQYTEVGDMSEGTAWGAMLWFIPLTEGQVAKKARDRAIAAAGADALVNVSLNATTYFFPLVTVYRTSVRGTPVTIND